jgi:hypothetical protein
MTSPSRTPAVKRHEPERPAAVECRLLAGEIGGDGCQLALCLRGCHGWVKATDYPKRVRAARVGAVDERVEA